MRSTKIKVLGLFRYLRPDHNPLRRPVDRAYARLVIGVVTLFAVTGAIVVALVVRTAGGAGVRAEQHQARSRHQVDAVVIERTSAAYRGGLRDVTRIRWRDAAGVARTGTVPARDGDRASAHRGIWVDRLGRQTTRPHTHVQTVTDTTLAALAALGGLAIPYGGAFALAGRRLERRRMALWEREWATIAPRWTGRS